MNTVARHLPEHPEQLHHAYVIRGDASGLYDYIEATLGVSREGHPDLYRYQTDRLSIEDARDIRHKQAMRPVHASKTVCVIEVNDILTDAQNALLKVLEDPAPSTIFFFVVPRDLVLLETVRSRVRLVDSDEPAASPSVDPTTFLAASPAQRLTSVGSIISQKDRRAAHRLIEGCQQILHERWSGVEAGDSRALEECDLCERYVTDPGSSVKLLLEHLAVTLPTVSSEQK